MSEAGLFQSRGATRQILLVLEGAESGSNTRQSRLRKTVSFFFFFFFFLENVSEVVGDLVVTDGKFPSRQLPAYRL